MVAHELAQLERRHAVRTVLQRTGVFTLMAILAGDASSITSLAGTLPAILLNSRYSRHFEREADAAAARWMDDAGSGGQDRCIRSPLTREEKDPDPGMAWLHKVKRTEAIPV